MMQQYPPQPYMQTYMPPEQQQQQQQQQGYEYAPAEAQQTSYAAAPSANAGPGSELVAAGGAAFAQKLAMANLAQHLAGTDPGKQQAAVASVKVPSRCCCCCSCWCCWCAGLGCLSCGPTLQLCRV